MKYLKKLNEHSKKYTSADVTHHIFDLLSVHYGEKINEI